MCVGRGGGGEMCSNDSFQVNLCCVYVCVFFCSQRQLNLFTQRLHDSLEKSGLRVGRPQDATDTMCMHAYYEVKLK